MDHFHTALDDELQRLKLLELARRFNLDESLIDYCQCRYGKDLLSIEDDEYLQVHDMYMPLIIEITIELSDRAVQ